MSYFQVHRPVILPVAYCVRREMELLHRDVLRRCHLTLVDELDVDPACDYLYQEKIFEVDDVERVRAEPTSHRKRSKFLHILPTKGPRAYDTFLERLWELEGQRHLRDMMSQSEADLKPDYAKTRKFIVVDSDTGDSPNPSNEDEARRIKIYFRDIFLVGHALALNMVGIACPMR